MTSFIALALTVTPEEAAAKRWIAWIVVGIILGALAALVVGVIHRLRSRKSP